MLLELRQQVQQALADALRALGHKSPEAPVRTWLEPSPHADLSTRVCFNLAPKAPAKLAADVAAKLKPSGLLGEVKAQGPYLNFSAAPAFHLQALKKILDEGDAHGHLGRRGRVVVEHTSANPDGPLHIGHLRNALLGDSLARILRRAGHEVQTHYYANDMGRQIGVLAWGLRHFEFNPGKKPDHAVAEVYIAANRALEKEPEKGGEVTQLLLKYEAQEPDAVALFRRGVQRCLDGIRATLDRLGAVHDEVVWESQFAGEAKEMLKEIEKLPGALRTPDGARGLALEGFEKELMLVRSDGTSLYASRDLAYHRWKGRWGAMVDVLGEDHKLYAKQLAAALGLLKLPAPETVHFEFVSLPEGSMSTRAGTYVAVDDLLDQVEAEAQKQTEARRGAELDAKKIKEIARAVALAAVRFDVLKVSAEKPTVFDWRTALDFEKRGGPFVLYAHTRAAAILRKASEQGLKPALPGDPAALGAPEREMVRELARFRLVLEEATDLRRPHLVAVYAQEAAEKFNQFYRDVPVLQAPEGQRAARLAVVEGGRIVLKNALECLGIGAIDEM
jgi:arginyl-tRNA synthetase